MKNDTKESIDRYVQHGYHPGSFLEAVLSNDLAGALYLADGDNAFHLREIVKYINEKVPIGAKGSLGAVKAWNKMGGLEAPLLGVT